MLRATNIQFWRAAVPLASDSAVERCQCGVSQLQRAARVSRAHWEAHLRDVKRYWAQASPTSDEALYEKPVRCASSKHGFRAGTVTCPKLLRRTFRSSFCQRCFARGLKYKTSGRRRKAVYATVRRVSGAPYSALVQCLHLFVGRDCWGGGATARSWPDLDCMVVMVEIPHSCGDRTV